MQVKNIRERFLLLFLKKESKGCQEMADS